MSSVYQDVMLFLQSIPTLALTGLLLPVSLLVFFFLIQAQLQFSSSRKNARQGKAYQNIESLKNFKLQETGPAILRPFKSDPAAQPTTFDTYLELDRDYSSNIETRREHLRTNLAASLACSPKFWDPVAEFYEWLAGTYLPHRYPSIFILMAPPPSSTTPEKGRGLMLRNKITSETIPATAPANDAEKALAALGAHVDADFVFLAPSPETRKYHVEAFVSCDGDSLKERLGRPVTDVADRVAGLAATLERKIDAFFSRLEGRRMYVHENWAVGSEVQGYLLGDLDESLKAEDEVSGFKALSLALALPTVGDKDAVVSAADVDLKTCKLRCQRQTLHRLPETNGLVFSSKSYYYSLDEIKAEGNGQTLASAIEGLRKDSAQSALKEKVSAYLRN